MCGGFGEADKSFWVEVRVVCVLGLEDARALADFRPALVVVFVDVVKS